MTYDSGGAIPRLHPLDLAALERAVQQGPARVPREAGDVPTGLDARVIREAVRDLISAQIANFLTRDQITNLIKEEIRSQLAFINLRVDDDHIDQTAEAMGATLKWHKRISAVTNTFIGGLILIAFYAGAKALGITLPKLPSMPE